MDDTWQSLKGQFLMAMPSLNDPNFYQSVTCMAEHNAKGAMGIVINRVHPEINAKMIFDELKIPAMIDAEQIPIHVGGPVHANEIFVLHAAPFTWEGSMMITSAVGLSNSRDILEAVAAGRPPRDYLIALGCAGWGPGQLESEIRGNAGLPAPFPRRSPFGWPWSSAGRRP